MKLYSKILSMAVICGVISCGSFTALAQTQEAYQVTAQITPQFVIEVDGEETTFFDASGNEVQPIVYNGTTYLPIRAIGELMGKNVNWDQSTLTVTLAGERTAGTVKGTEDEDAEEAEVTVQIRPDFTIVVDNVQRSFTDANGDAVYAMLYNGSTYLPLRAIGQIMGKNVLWTEETKTISLYGTTSTELLVTDADTFDTASAETDNSNTGSRQESWYQPGMKQMPDFQNVNPPRQGGNNGFMPGPNGNQFENRQMIGEEAAKRKALEHAGLKSADKFQIKQKTDKGRRIYNIEFRNGNTTYEYDVDAYTGEIIDIEKETKKEPENKKEPVKETDTGKKTDTEQQKEYIGEDKAGKIALAEVDGAEQSHIVKIKLDDGVYDVEIVYEGVEYEFEIDAYTGEILELDSETID